MHQVLAEIGALGGLTVLAFALHIGAGFVALFAGYTAIFAPKGGRVHILSGRIFFWSMVAMAVAALFLAVVRPGQLVNVLIAIFALYFVATSWATIRRPDGRSGWAERIALAVSLVLFAPFAVLVFQLSAGMTPYLKSTVALEGSVFIALCSFTAVLGIAAIGDAKVLLAGGIAGKQRIARHLWRMCLSLTLATGSAFTNGFARLLPGPYHVPLLFFLPQLVPLLLLVFWVVRVRLMTADRASSTLHG